MDPNERLPPCRQVLRAVIVLGHVNIDTVNMTLLILGFEEKEKFPVDLDFDPEPG